MKQRLWLIAGGLIGIALIVMASASPLSITRAAAPAPLAGDALTVVAWNLGYGGLGAESDFSADGGKSYLPPSSKTVTKNVAGIVDTLKATDADVYILPEIAKRSPANYWHDLLGAVTRALPDTERVFSAEVLTRFWPWPIRFEHGLAIFSRKQIGAVNIEKLPLEKDKLGGLIQREYAARIVRLPVEGQKDWVIIGVHLAAFDKNAETRKAQLARVVELAQALHAEGSPVIIGGDFNLVLAQTSFSATTEPEHRSWVHDFPAEALPAGWRIGADPRVASVRTNERPYKAGENYTAVIDGFIVSPGVEIESVETRDLGFQFSDHQPVMMKVKRSGSAPVSRSEDRGP